MSRRRSSNTVPDGMRAAERRNVGKHHDRKIDEARQQLERRRAEREATEASTDSDPEADQTPDSDPIPLPDEPAADDEPPTAARSTPDFDDEFWSSRVSLARIRDYALACMVSPWGFLGVLIVYALDSVPYSTALPGIADDPAPGSLNTIVGLVAESGGNKSRILRTVRAYVGRSDLDLPIGSGEGIAKSYVRRPQQRRSTDPADEADTFRYGTDLYEWQRRNAVFVAPEVDTLAALMKRSGATLAGALRQAFSGETLGFAYADETKRALVPDGGYRFGLIVGIQPKRSSALLDDADGGTPQRLLWMPVADPRCRRDNRPALPEPYVSAPHPELWPDRISLPPVATEAIEIAAEERAQGDGNPLDGHRLFVRAKVAAALAVIDGRTAVSAEDWQLSQTAMRVSDTTRSRCVAALRSADEQANRARAEAEGIRTDITEETRRQRAVERIAQTIVRAVTTHGPMTRRDAKTRVSSRDRAHFNDAIATAVDDGLLVADDDGVRLP